MPHGDNKHKTKVSPQTEQAKEKTKEIRTVAAKQGKKIRARPLTPKPNIKKKTDK